MACNNAATPWGELIDLRGNFRGSTNVGLSGRPGSVTVSENCSSEIAWFLSATDKLRQAAQSFLVRQTLSSGSEIIKH